MSKKFLGKVIAGAALGGASLLVWAPSTALADGGYHPDGYQKHDSGHVFAKPEVAKPGQEVKFLEVCSEPQKHAWLWSKVTGKVDLAPKDHEEGHEAGKEVDKKAEESKDGWDDGAGKPGNSAEDGAKPGDPGSRESSAEDYKKEREYQEFLKYKEQQEYLEYRRYKEKSAPGEKEAPEAEGAPSAGEGAPVVPGPTASAVPAPTPSTDGQLPQPAEGYQPPPAGAGGGMADDAKPHEEGEPGWDSKKAEEGKPGWDDKKAEEGKPGWDDKKAGYEYWASVTIPWDAKPGTYELKGSCGEGEFVVTPKGWVDGGDGGATSGNSDNLAVAGVGLLGMASLGGLVLMRQRRTDESHA